MFGPAPEPVVQPPPSSIRRGWKSLKAYAAVAVTLALILYFGALLIGRTEGFRSLVAQRFSRMLGVDLVVREASLSPGLRLTLAGIGTKARKADDAEEGRPVSAAARIEADRVRLSFRIGHGWIRTAEVEGGRAWLVRDAWGEWSPAPLAGAAGWLDETTGLGLPSAAAPGPAKPTTGGPDRKKRPAKVAVRDPPALRIRSADLHWLESDGRERAALTGMVAEITPLRTPRRNFTHVWVEADSFVQPGGALARHIHAELMVCGDRRFTMDWSLGKPAPAEGGGDVPPVPGLEPPSSAPPAPASGPLRDVDPVQ